MAEQDDTVLWRFSTLVDLTAAERQTILSLLGQKTHFAAGQAIHVQDGEPGLYLLHEGWVLGGIDLSDGSRQVLKVHRPGDVMGTPSLPFAQAVESLVALTPARVSPISRKALGALFTQWPRLAAIFFIACQVERVVLMDRLLAAGTLDASRNFVALMLQLFQTKPPGATDTRLHLPLTQPQLGEVLGLSTVHVNRVVRSLERNGLLRRDGYVYDLIDVARLEAYVGLPRRAPERNPAWLPLTLPDPSHTPCFGDAKPAPALAEAGMPAP